MSPDDYRARFGSGQKSAPSNVWRGPVAASAPSDVMDRSMLGDEWVSFLAQTSDVSLAEQAARASAVYFCCSIIAEAVGSLQTGFVDARNNAVSVSMAEVIGLEPNPLQTAAEFWASMAYTAALRGIAFAEPTVGLDNVELWPLDPRGTSVTWRDRSFSVN